MCNVGMADLGQSHVNQHEDHEELKMQRCSGSTPKRRDDGIGINKCNYMELDEENNRNVQQKVFPSNVPMGETSATCGVEMATSIQVAHKVQKESQLKSLSKYDVFLNHRGCDVKKSFASHLDAALRRCGREPFLDAKSLIEGHHAFESINEVLSGVYCHIAIFSPRYAESKYCLNELCDMLASKKPIIPVFYNVEPKDLCQPDEKGPFVKAFNQHKKKGRNQDVIKWKEALQEAANITGFKLIDSDNEAMLVERITSAVLEALPPPPPLVSARHLVGLKKSLAHVVGMLHKMGEIVETVGVLGIHGMGGIGKTTLAKEIYNHEQARFPKRCFLQDTKDAKQIALMDLRKQLVKDLLGKDVKMVGDYARCMEMIGKHKVLIVIDDISSRKQFCEIIPNINLLAPGSRVVITCQATDILNHIMFGVPQHALYGMEVLSLSDSLELLIWCAFRKLKLDDVEDSFHESVNRLAKACGGLPLALEVMGGFLADKKNDQECWIKVAFALTNHLQVVTSLKISYEGLVHEGDKSMFVDIACFMLGHPKDVALAVWDSIDEYNLPSRSLVRLMEKGLVKVVDGGLLSMHDLLRDMGCNIVKEMARERDKMQSHVWDPSMATRIIQNEKGLKQILALSLIGADLSMTWQAKSFEEMKKLRYLFLDGCLVHGDFSRWPKELRWLQWRHFYGDEIPRSLRLSNLAVLDLANSDKLTHLWTINFGEESPCKNLQVLILTKCTNLKNLPRQMEKLLKLKLLNLEECKSLNSLPSSLGDVIGLQKLYLNGCELLQKLPTSISKLSKLTELNVERTAIQELPTNFGQLGDLKKVWFSDCKSLRELPESFGGLSNLEEFNLDGCELLQKVPTSISKLSKLTELSVQRTAIEELPSNFGQLGDLKKVWFSDCKSLHELPESFGGLSNLEVLNLNGCESLQKLPTSTCKLSKLTDMSVQRTAIQELPTDFGQLSRLKRVWFSHCKRLHELPESFGGLSNLEELNLHGCELLQKLPTSISKLSKLTEFSVERTGIRELPTDFGQLSGLKSVCFSDCKSLHELPKSFGGLSNLEELDLDGCGLLQKLPASISKLSKLTKLSVQRTAIQELPLNFGQLGDLKKVWFSDCKSLHKLPKSFGGLSNLEVLNLNGCESLQKLPTSICKLSKLTDMSVQRIAIQELPTDFGQLSRLKRVWFSHCKRLHELPESFGGLSNLEELNLHGCELLQKLPTSISKLSKLIELSVQRTAIQELPSNFGQLGDLKKVWFSDCKSLRELPESFGGLSNLEEFNLDGCELLQKVPTSISKLSKLTELSVQRTAIEELPSNFGQLGDLKKVWFSDCKSLHELPESFGGLSNLEVLNLNGCESLQKLPTSTCKLSKLTDMSVQRTAIQELPTDFSQLSRLKRVWFSHCKRLHELPESFGGLSNLEELNLHGCELLQKLPTSISKLSKLIELSVQRTAIQELPSNFGQLGDLKKVWFRDCKSLRELPESFGGLNNLEVLNLDGCGLLQKLPASISKLSKLTDMSVQSTAIQELPTDFGQLSRLKRVWFSDCTSLHELPESFEGLSNLEELNLDGCELLQKLPTSICKLSKLTELNVQRTAIQELPTNFGQLGGLKRIWFCDCKSLRELPESFGGLCNLEELWLNGCHLLQSLPLSFSNLFKLIELNLKGMALEALPNNFGELCSLEKLYLSYSISLKLLPLSISALCNLEVLHLDGCSLLQTIPPSVCQLKKLKEICLNYMVLTKLPEEFSQLKTLRQVDLEGCNLLHTLCETFGNLTELQKLNLKGCRSLIRLPESFSKLENLEELDLRGCGLLQSHPPSTIQLSVQVGGDDGTGEEDSYLFYATPHDRSKLADLASYLPKMGEMVARLKVINDNFGRLNEHFEHIEQICDSVYLLKAASGTPELEIVFIHGLQLSDCKEAYWKTWIAGKKDTDGKEVLWPMTWLGNEFPGARILSVCYDSSALKTNTTGRMDGYVLGETLVTELVDFAKVGQRQNCPIVFVCHSLGGLIVKEMVISAHVKHRNDPKYVEFLRNIGGYHFYATPHDGSKLADLASWLPKMGKMVAELRVINDNLGRLNEHFESIEEEDFSGKWQFAVVAETHKTEYLGFSAKVVEEASARHGYKKFLSVGADHFGVCTPEDRRNNSYKSLTQFIAEVVMAQRESNFTSRSRIPEAGQNRLETEDDELTSLDIFQSDVNSIQPQWLEDVKSLISTTMVSLGIRQTPTIIERGANQLVQHFQGNTKGIAAGRLDTTTKEIQIILSDLETMVNVTGVGLRTEKFVLVTLGGGHDPSKAVMSVIEETDCEELNSSGDAFYLLHFTEDVYKDQDYHARGLLQGDYSSCSAYRVHIVAKLLLLMKCEDLDDESFRLKIKDLSLDRDWQDLRIAICKCESISNLGNQNDVQYQERGGTRHGGSGSGGSCQNSNSSSCSDRNKGKGKINNNQVAKGDHDENNMDGGDKEDDEHDDRNGGKSFSTCTNPMERESYSIEVRPGYDKYKIKEGENWSYKTVHATVTPLITITFKKSAPFRNCSNEDIEGREVQVKLDVNLALGDSEPDHEEMQKFAWFHDYFGFSFKCMKEGAAGLKPNSGFIHGLKDQKATRGKGSTLNSEQWNVQVQGGVKAGPPIAQGTFQTTLSRSGATSATHDEESRDTTRIQTAQGFDVVQKFNGGGKPSFGAKFTYGDIDVQSQCLKEDGTCKKESYNLPICNSQDISLEGTFQPLEDANKYYKYRFQCKRDIKGWFWMKPKPTPTEIDSAPTSASSSTRVSSSSSTPTSTSSSTWVSPSSSTPTSTSSSTLVSATSSHCRKEQSNSFLQNLSCMSFGKGINEGALKRFKSIKESWILKPCKQSFEFDIHINHAMNHIHKLANQYPNGIPAIGPKYEYESVIATSTIHHKSTSCDGLKSACSRPD